MERLLKEAARRADQAEVYHLRRKGGNLQMRNGRTTDVEATIQSGYALRIIRDGKIGTAYTKNLLDREAVVAGALESLKGEVTAGFTFPGGSKLPETPPLNPAIRDMGFDDLHGYCDSVLKRLEGKAEGQRDVQAGFGTSEMELVNTSGASVRQNASYMVIYGSLLFPNTETRVHKLFMSSKPAHLPDTELEELVSLYRTGLPEVDVPTGRMKVMFMPDSMYTLIWRVSMAASGKSAYDGVSPLLERVGEKVVSERFGFYDDPSDPNDVETRHADDEGVPTKRHDIIEDGVFNGFIVNLDYADKLGIEPTGCGYRESMWGGETIAQLPAPKLFNRRLKTGGKSFDEMVRSMERGVIVFGVLGAHSGNILNGDFSIGLNPGFYVEGGEIKGRVRDGMVAGNAWDVLSRVSAVEDRLHQAITGDMYPAVLLDDVSVSARD